VVGNYDFRLDPQTRGLLEQWARSSSQQRAVRRSRIILALDGPGRGRPKGRRADAVASILEATATPPTGVTRWTSRALATHLGISHSTVLRVWRDAGKGAR
jgi:hypothetical protein